ncbi:MAG: glycosyltransferase [Pyrinomonadaceae bacterium]|nr:glycosyltransferase [Pyrinomonadaceae bacterium]
MNGDIPRVAYFPDSLVEVNGVAMTSKRLIGFAKKNGYPFLCVYSDDKTKEYQDGSVEYLALKQSPLAMPMDVGLKYDPLYQRHTSKVLKKLVAFKPDVMHITGLNDVSIMGAYLSWKMSIPLVGSWHTNLHEYAARRLSRLFSFLPSSTVGKFTGFIEDKVKAGAILYYKMPKILLAPNQELVDMLEKGTDREARLMIRGVDTEMFNPAHRTVSDGTIRFGFVGRLRAEKNVRVLQELEEELLKKTDKKFEFLIVGDGNEREWLEANMKTAVFTGFIDGQELSEAYANMDVFVFPSETDAFGNVVQEANASGAPCLVTDAGGPQFIVQKGETGYVCKNLDDFVRNALDLMDNREKLLKMKEASREFALSRSWDSVFESVYEAYRECIRQKQKAIENKTASPPKL